jgi:hypothetical protein
MDGVTQRLQPRIWRVVIILLTLAALVDGYLLTRAYVARNADTVVILATDYDNRLSLPPSQRILGHTTIRYTGDTAHQIQRAIDTYPFLAPGGDSERGECPLPGTDHTYQYQFTFLLAGIPVEVADTETGGCVWSRVVLGLPERATYAMATGLADPLSTIFQLTNDALPT